MGRLVFDLLLAVLLTQTAAAGEDFASDGSTFVAGAICQGSTSSELDARSLLSGKHLKVYEINWPPFAMSDNRSKHGWTGLNVDVRSRT